MMDGVYISFLVLEPAWPGRQCMKNGVYVFFMVSEPPRPCRQYMMDGVYVSESGLNQIKSLALKMPEKKRQRRWKPREMQRHPHISRLLGDKEEGMEMDDTINKGRRG